MPEADSWWFQRQWSDFRRGTAEIVISWPDGSARALLYTDGVPETAAAFKAALPLEASLVHVAWSGEMVMGTQTYDFGPGHAENEVRLVRPGDLTWDSKYGELGLVYGTAECRLPSGPNCVTVFGSVIEGADALAAFCRARRFEGSGMLRFESGAR
jgi:hypothetical protein